MSADFQIKNDENPKNSSCGGSVEISYDGGKTYEAIGHSFVMLDVDWDHPAVMDLVGPAPAIGYSLDYSLGYTISATGNVAFFDDLLVLGDRSVGIVNHPAVIAGDGKPVSKEQVLEGINNLISEFERSIPRNTILFECSPSVQLCIDALKNDHYASLGITGGSMATGKGKKAHKKMHRKMFGGW